MNDLLEKRREWYPDTRPPLLIAEMYILERVYVSRSCRVDDPQPHMSLTYGYDLEDDKILEAPTQITEIMSPLVIPRGA
jgi:hypothetical protein